MIDPDDRAPDRGGDRADRADRADEARRALTALVRESGRDVLATLARTTGDLALAEDAVQDAVVRALEAWPRDGVPPNPVAWLRLVARRRAVDLVRREASGPGRNDTRWTARRRSTTTTGGRSRASTTTCCA